jgi:hypothetical protein
MGHVQPGVQEFPERFLPTGVHRVRGRTQEALRNEVLKQKYDFLYTENLELQRKMKMLTGQPMSLKMNARGEAMDRKVSVNQLNSAVSGFGVT